MMKLNTFANKLSPAQAEIVFISPRNCSTVKCKQN